MVVGSQTVMDGDWQRYAALAGLAVMPGSALAGCLGGASMVRDD